MIFVIGEISGLGSGFMKAWVRYEFELLRAFIFADAGELVRHAVPYITSDPFP